MWRAIWQLSARRTLTWHLPVFLLLCGYTLMVTHPLGVDPPAAVFGGLQGWVLAFRLFVDPPCVSPFIFSRPFSRTRLFLYRWLIGLLLQAITLAVVFADHRHGSRQFVQVHLFRSDWYPMVRWFELSTLWPVGLASLLMYQATCFVLSAPPAARQSKNIEARADGQCGLLGLGGIDRGRRPVRLRESHNPGRSTSYWELFPPGLTLPTVLLLCYTALLVAATTLAALHCCRRFEVNA